MGDAAGRVDARGRKIDHANTDFTMALNAGLRFATPEEHFFGKKVAYPNPPASFRPDLEDCECSRTALEADDSAARDSCEQTDYEQQDRVGGLCRTTVSCRQPSPHHN